MKKIKCLLVHTPRLHNNNGKITSDINYLAMGLFSLAGELYKNNFDVKILHLGIEKYLNKNFKLSSYIKENNIKLLALSLQWNFPCYDVIETARVIKNECPDVFIVLGGYTASFFAKEILEKFCFIDAVIKGEGEIPIVSLAQALENRQTLNGVENLYWRKNGQIVLNDKLFIASSLDLDTFSFFNPEYMLHYEEYSKIPFILDYSQENQLTSPASGQGICLGRGCLGNCVWCGGGFLAEKKVSGRNFISYRSPDSVISEIKMMKNEYNIEFFRFSFDPNPNDRSFLIDLFNKMASEFKEKLNILYNIDGLPDKDFLDAYNAAASSASTLFISPVCYNEGIRRKYKSFFYTNKQLEETLTYMNSIGLKSEIYFSEIPGIEKSVNEKSKEYAEYLKSHYSCVSDSYCYEMTVVPASPWTENPDKYNIKEFPKTFTDYYNINKSFENSFEL